MEAKDSFTLTWCEKHKNWWVTNCPDCMVDANEENIKREGIEEVVESFYEAEIHSNPNTMRLAFIKVLNEWQAKLKGVEK